MTDVGFNYIIKMLQWVLTYDGCQNNIHRTGGKRNPNRMENSIFCESTKLGGGLLSVFGGLLKLENSLRFDKKYFGRSHFRS